ncbi:MAG: FHA domain-containing protein [Planctomycetota bacterium]
MRLRDGEQLFVGRAQSCEVVIPCKSVSKRHARFVRQDDQVVIEDLGSRNGIRVNGVQVESAYLEPGDLIQVGRATLRLKGRGLVASGEETGFELVDGADDALKPRLVLVDDLSSSWDLSESSTIGCRSENSIQLEGLGVSRFHAEVVKQGDSWVIKDLGATNGVSVNGEKVDSAILESGDEILIGQTRMRFELVAPRTPRKQALRVVLAAAVALFCCATGVAASVGGGEGVELAVAENEDFLAGTQALIAGRYAQAQDRFASAELTLALGDKGDSRALRQLARELERIQTEPASALWARGEELLARCLRLNLAPEVEAWLQSQRAFLRDNRGAQERLDQALTQTESAQREANLDQALAAFMDAAVVCEGIGAEALCSERAQAAAERAEPGDRADRLGPARPRGPDPARLERDPGGRRARPRVRARGPAQARAAPDDRALAARARGRAAPGPRGRAPRRRSCGRGAERARGDQRRQLLRPGQGRPRPAGRALAPAAARDRALRAGLGSAGAGRPRRGLRPRPLAAARGAEAGRGPAPGLDRGRA